MNEAEIDQYLKTHPLTKEVYQGVYARDELAFFGGAPNSMFVVNTDLRSEPGAHWVFCYWPSEGLPLYFDSYGFFPLYEEFYQFLLSDTSNFKYNKVQLQDIDTDVCGHYVMYFASQLCAGVPLEEIRSKHFTNNAKLNDRLIVTLFRKEFGYPVVNYKCTRKPMTCHCLCSYGCDNSQ